MMFNTPPTPSASYFIEGFVTTSIRLIDEAGIDYAKTAVGDKYVYEYMIQNGCRIGGEQSGHVILRKYATTGDGILTAIMLMERIVDSKLPLSKLAEPVIMYPQVTINIRVPDKDAVLSDPAVLKVRDELAARLGDNGRILLRKSGTEPVVRVMVEAPDKSTCESLAEEMASVIRK